MTFTFFHVLHRKIKFLKDGKNIAMAKKLQFLFLLCQVFLHSDEYITIAYEDYIIFYINIDLLKKFCKECLEVKM